MVDETTPTASKPQFTPRILEEIKRVCARYPQRRAGLLPVLWIAQREFGWISPGVVELVADVMGLTPADVWGVVTFYTMYHTKPPGRYHVQICRNLTCSLLGAEGLIEHAKAKLGVDPGETRSDGMFSLELVECLQWCDRAPMMRLNDRVQLDLTPERFDRVVDGLE
jgi:NADH-quinone oxidoreductase subunit E